MFSDTKKNQHEKAMPKRVNVPPKADSRLKKIARQIIVNFIIPPKNIYKHD